MSIDITIPLSSLTDDIRKLLADGVIKHMVIDYADNTIVGYTLTDEVEVFQFGNYLMMDNRYNKYDISYAPEGINLKIISTRP
jgi:DNA-binding Lrp family transcriptional regulator